MANFLFHSLLMKFYGCTDTFPAAPKTVHWTAKVCSLNSGNFATPKTVRWPAEVCSFRCLLRKLSVELQRSAVLEILNSVYSENCPLTCQGLQFFVKKWKKCSLLRKLSVDLPPFAVCELVCWPAPVCSLNRRSAGLRTVSQTARSGRGSQVLG